MLKAIRFDEKKHEELLKFITSYKDNKNRSNESEAIRFLMQKGYEALNKEQDVVHVTSLEEPKMDLDSIKKEIYAEVMAQVSSQALGSISALIDKIGDLKPIYIQQQDPLFTQVNSNTPEFTKINSSETKIKTTSPIEIPKDTNPLLANILGNANR